MQKFHGPDSTRVDFEAGWKTRSVIVYEPTSFLRRLTSQVLRHGGARHVIEIGEPESVIEHLAAVDRPILVGSWKPENNDGLKLVRQVRSLSTHLKKTEVLLLSSRCRLGDIEIARDAGINDYLVRPFSARDINFRIDQMTRSRPEFVETVRYQGPDRRRARPNSVSTAKRQADILSGRVTPMQAALNQADDIAQQMMRRHDLLGARVGRSLRHFLERLSSLTPDSAEVIALHRSTLARLQELSTIDPEERMELVSGLEQIAGTHAEAA